MARNQFIGLDLGRSAVKLVARGPNGVEVRIAFPSAVMKAPPSLVYREVEQSAASDTVVMDGETLWTGETALKQGVDQEPIGRSDEWVVGKAHDALVLSAISRLNEAGFNFDPARAVITLGVPSRVAKDRRDILIALKANVLKRLSTGKDRPMINVIAQPVGVIASHALAHDGEPREGQDPDTHSFAVIEVGQYTTDYCAVLEGEPIVSATESSEGVELVAMHVAAALREQGLELGPRNLQRMMLTPTINARGKQIDLRPLIAQAVKDHLLPKTLETARAVFRSQLLQESDAVLVAGGGAGLIYELLKKDPQFTHAVQVAAPREAVADGFSRLSAAFAHGAGDGRAS